MKYIPTIGLEIHAHLKTKTKMFCDSLNDHLNAEPNTNVCAVCMGHPGVLPVANKEAINKVIQVGLALNCQIAGESKFDRKNYFYPDLPKGYQISQYDIPFCLGGYIDIPIKSELGGEYKRIDIERIHLEEDAGRLVHSQDNTYSLVDFNRAGVPLMELVTKPVISSAFEAIKFAKELRLILRYLGTSDADMERGQMRVEVNLSLAPAGSKILGTKVELKNLNSLRVVEDATAYEINRQTRLLDSGEKIVQETRGWDEMRQETFSQRSKEEAQEYRYFPEPDLPPMIISREHGFDLDKMKKSMVELPQAKRNRFQTEYDHASDIVDVLIEQPNLADYFEKSVSEALSCVSVNSSVGILAKKKVLTQTEEKIKILTTNYVVKNLRTLLQDTGTRVEDIKITPENFGEFICLIHKGEINSAGAREVLEAMFNSGGGPSAIVEKKGLKQVSDEDVIGKFVQEIVEANEDAVRNYKEGKEEALKFLVGQVMARSKGAANPKVAEKLLKKKLK